MRKPRFEAGPGTLSASGINVVPVVRDMSFNPPVIVAWVLWDVTMPYDPQVMAEEIAAGLNCRHEARLAMTEDKDHD